MDTIKAQIIAFPYREYRVYLTFISAFPLSLVNQGHSGRDSLDDRRAVARRHKESAINTKLHVDRRAGLARA